MEIRKELIKICDENYKKFNQKLCPDTKREMLGIRVPNIKKLAKKIINEYEIKDCLEKVEDKYFEEVLLQGFIIGYSKIDLQEKLTYIKDFVPKIDSWAISDSFVPSLNIRKKDLPKVWEFILPYISSENEFYVRFAIIMMLDYFLTEEYVDQVLTRIDSIKHEGYYVKMGIAWLVAEVGIKFNDRAMKYLKNNNLDKFTYNKSIQKMIESRRISDKQKVFLKTQKRK